MEERDLDASTGHGPAKKAKTPGLPNDDDKDSDKPNAALDHLYKDFADSEGSHDEGDDQQGAEVHEEVQDTWWTTERMVSPFWCDGLELWDYEVLISRRKGIK
mmetsp:Transcript_34021/g.80251  ORF Transcript_34021/g.80251 Transcript_34021/m.80251 type:complete len:103 (+) Transcript_34021:110-418(+)